MTRVLVVDDNEMNVDVLRALLQRHDYMVLEAKHGADALTLARNAPPALVISDLMMPVMDGFTLLRHWNTDDRLKDIPFIVYTATYTESQDERLALDLGAAAFIAKPADPEEFLARIRAILAKEKSGELPPGPDAPRDASDLVAAHNEVLFHKLERKILQLEESNRLLQQEIDDRVRSEAALRETEHRYRNLFHSITDALFVFDRETFAILDVNDSAVAKYGYPRTHCLGMSILDMHPANERPRVSDALARTLEAPMLECKWRHQTSDGSTIDVEVSTYNLDYAGRSSCLVHARDVSTQVQAELGAKRTADLLRAVADGTPDAVFVKNRDGKYLLFNESAAGFVGKPIDAVLGKDDTEVFGPVDAEVIMANDKQVMDSNAIQTVEELLTTTTGPRTFLATKVPYRDEHGEVIGIIGISRDITEQRKLEEQLRQSQKMEAVGRLAGGVAHDFNNLLTIVSGYAEMLIGHSALGAMERESIDAIRDASQKAAALTRQLLAFSRQSVIQPETLDINGVVAEMGKMLQRLIGEDVLFVTLLDPKLGRVKVDAGQLDQVLINLAVNARDAMPMGGTLTVETRNVTLDNEGVCKRLSCKPGNYVMISVTDTGCGMTREVLDHIFEPFFTTKEIGKGTGLGLPIVFGFVQQSDGAVEVDSEPGRGTTFRIYLPQAEGCEPPRDSAPARHDLHGTETILVAEDEEAVRRLATRSLSLHGYTVLTSTDGEDALTVLDAHDGPVDLVFSDVVMPNMGGPELVKRVKMRYPDIKVLFTSGYTDDAVIRYGLLDEHMSFIQKPYTPMELARKMRQVLDAHEPPR